MRRRPRFATKPRYYIKLASAGQSYVKQILCFHWVTPTLLLLSWSILRRNVSGWMSALCLRNANPTERKTMNRRNFVNLTFVSLAGLSLATDVIGQQKIIEPDLTALADGKVLSVVNCCLSGFKDGAKNGVRLSGDCI